MASNNGHSRPEDALAVSDELIRRFVLGALDQGEQSAFEYRLLSDHALAGRVRLAELELADDYAYDRLSAGERELMAERFLLSRERAQQVSVSSALKEQFGNARSTSPRTSVADYVRRFRSVLGVRRPAWRLAFTAFILILLVGTTWLVVKKEPAIKRQIVETLQRKRSPAPSAPVETHHPTNITTPEHETSPSPMPVHDERATESPIRLTPGSTENDAPSIDVPAGQQDNVRVQLALKSDQPGSYRAEVMTTDGRLVLNVDAVRGADNSTVVSFEVPAQWLKPGSYRVRLDRENAGAREDVGVYYFRVK